MYSDNDPRSWNYKRKYSRPHINFLKAGANTLSVFALWILAFALLHFKLSISIIVSVCISLLIPLLVAIVRLKSIVVWCVRCYQHFAPIRIRSMCRFEPSCSEYTILAIEKYGVLRGCHKGINRIIRCAHKDGGFDYP